MTYSDVVIETWDPDDYSWKVPQVFKRVEIHERHSLDDGPIIYFNIPDGQYSDGTKRVRRWSMESPRPWNYIVAADVFYGFVFAEVFEKGQTKDFDGYLKQRWTIRPRKARRKAST